MFDSSRGHLLQALMLSLGLHVLLMLSVVSVFPARLEMLPATIRVVLGGGRASPPANAAPSKLSAPPDRPRPVAKTRETSRPIVEPESSGATATEHPPQAVAAAVEAAPEPQSPTASANTPASAPASLREGVSADDLRQYRLSLAIAARRFKRYPAVARERGWEGTAEVAVSVNALLPAPEVILVRSSGRAALDEQAFEMMAQAARSTALPESLKGRDFRVLLPVRFSLEGNQ